MQSHFICASIVLQLFEDRDLAAKEDVSQNLKPSQISQNLARLAKHIKMIKITMNLFSCDIGKSCLFNITSGKSTKDQAASFLLNDESIVRDARAEFIKECSEDTTRSEKPVKPRKVHTFATGNTTFKLQEKKKEIIAISFRANLFGYILFLSLKQGLTWERF